MRRSLGLLVLAISAACADGAPTAPDAGAPDAARVEPSADAGALDAQVAACRTPPHAPACDDQLCVIPAGCFVMGSPLDEACRDPSEVAHPVTLTRDLLLSRTEISRADFRAVMGYETYGILQDHPVTQVTWHEAAAYANALSARDGFEPCYACTDTGPQVRCIPSFDPIYDCQGYRHPTEAEWEHAYRAGTSEALYNGTITGTCAADPRADAIAWYGPTSLGAIHGPGGRAPNAWGLYDMAGNAFEWTFDRETVLTASAALDPVHPLESPDDPAVIRSGDWQLYLQFIRAASRVSAVASQARYSLGFRVARTLSATEPRPVGLTDGPPQVPGPEPCSPNVLAAPLQLPDGPRMHVEIPFEGRPQLLLVDTGSSLTNFYFAPTTPPVSPGVGLVTLGCEQFPFYGRNVRAGQSVRGLPVLGALGTDWILARPTVLDIAAEQVERWATAAEVPDRAGLIRLPYTLARGLLLVEARLDGVPVRLMLDTGTPRTLWIGPTGAATDEVVLLEGESGSILSVREGSATVELAGDAVVTELIWRTPTAGALEVYLRRLAPDVVGILGLASLGLRRVYFGVEEGVLLLEPR